EMAGVHLPTGPALADIEVGAADATQRADAPSAVELVVDAHQGGTAAVAELRGVAVRVDPASLAVDLDPCAGVGLGIALRGEAVLPVHRPCQGCVADQPAAVDHGSLHTRMRLTGELVDDLHGLLRR